MYHDILLFLHLIGLTMGLGVGIVNMMLSRWAGESDNPDTASILRSLPPRLSQISTIGLVVLVITGLLMLFTLGGMATYSFNQFWFYVKLLGAGAMIAIAYLVFLAQAQIRRGETPAIAQYMPMVGPAMGVLSLVIVFISVMIY